MKNLENVKFKLMVDYAILMLRSVAHRPKRLMFCFLIFYAIALVKEKRMRFQDASKC